MEEIKRKVIGRWPSAKVLPIGDIFVLDNVSDIKAWGATEELAWEAAWKGLNQIVFREGGCATVVSSTMDSALHVAAPLTKEQMQARIKMLSEEIDANEEGNRVMQGEITALYANIDALN